MKIEEKLQLLIKNTIEELFACEIKNEDAQVQVTRKEFKGEYTLVVFPFLKLSKKSPEETAKLIGEELQKKVDEIKEFNVIKGFLNLSLSDSFWIEQLRKISLEKNFGFKQKLPSESTYMVEYSSPNTNKPLHLGHLRNNFLGYSVAEILKANGHQVIKTQIINDRGIHICKSMVAWLNYAPKLNNSEERETPGKTGEKGDHFVGRYYVIFDKEYKNQIAELVKGGMTEEEAKEKAPLMLEARDTLVKWEARDPETYLLWSTMNGWVYEGFEGTYKRMGVNFDSLYYESDTYILGKDQIIDGLKRGVFYKKDDGSIWCDLTDEGLDHKLVLRSDGTAVYMTQDIGTAIERFKDVKNLNGIVYTVGNEQDYHFKVLFLILKKLGYEWAENCYHLSYGMVDLPTGKMKSREGTVVDADDLMEDIVQKAKEMTSERGHLEGLSDKDKNTLYESIGLGGLKYYLLKVDPKKRLLFNPEESVDLSGHTGPFIQYAHARICSLIKKAGSINYEFSEKIDEHELTILRNLSEFPDIIENAGKEFNPAILANYLYELVKSFNQFYQSVPILKEENEQKKNLRLAISEQVSKVIKKGLNLLGINAPEQM